ncbi:hypothetical protein EJA72_10525 [Pseudomonas sp. PB120]|uniref:hypothetical protein n=1 Tax=Pseudomonas sp. PB120 TaxID=2494700 RepID=UPI0012FD9E25|nr:hypothetical protein [Pseudomonas sp. PB120]MVV48672.1 hypothetical protein [Pseudomonas sp. PB120]
MSAFEVYWFPVILAGASTVVGVCLAPWWANYQSARVYRRRNDYLGDWESTWQDADDPTQWVTEKVNVDVAKGRLRLTNSDNVGGYEWQGSCDIYDNRYLYGTWKSRRNAAPSTGVFSFLTLPQGQVLVGQAMGQDREGVARTSDWILAREQKGLAQGKQWLVEHGTYFHGDA